MMCCAVAALIAAAIAAWGRFAKLALTGLAVSRWVVASVLVTLVLAGGSALAAHQLDRTPRQIDFASFLAHRICGFASQGDDAAPSPGRGNTKR